MTCLTAMVKVRSKDTAAVVADGVAGVWIHSADSLREFVEGFKTMVDSVVIDPAGIWSDTDLLSSRIAQGTHRAWQGLTKEFFYAVVGK